MDQQKIGAFLKELRRERGLTQEDLAGRTGLTPQAIGLLESVSRFKTAEAQATA